MRGFETIFFDEANLHGEESLRLFRTVRQHGVRDAYATVCGATNYLLFTSYCARFESAVRGLERRGDLLPFEQSECALRDGAAGRRNEH